MTLGHSEKPVDLYKIKFLLIIHEIQRILKEDLINFNVSIQTENLQISLNNSGTQTTFNESKNINSIGVQVIDFYLI